jgi:hypothetical protein
VVNIRGTLLCRTGSALLFVAVMLASIQPVGWADVPVCGSTSGSWS